MSSSEKREKRDFLGGKPPIMNAKTLGFRAVNVLKVVSASFVLTGLAYLLAGLFSRNIKISAQFLAESMFNAGMVLLVIYFCRISYLFAFCTVCGILHFVVNVLTFIAILILVLLGNFDSIDILNSGEKSLHPFVPKISPTTINIVLILVLTTLILQGIGFGICSLAFWKMSGIWKCGGAENRYDVEEVAEVKPSEKEEMDDAVYFKSEHDFMLKPVLFDKSTTERY